MTDNPAMVHGIPLKEWEAAFRPGMAEFAATRFIFTMEAMEQIRIAFGNNGPFVDHGGTRAPIYTHAVTLNPDTAVELARLILKTFAAPKENRPTASTEA